MQPTAAQALNGLTENQRSVPDLEAPSSPGVYALFLAAGSELAGVAQPGRGPLYVGTTGNLAQREFDTHFRAGQSGFSTLRRSLGALLIDELDLEPQPRGKGSSSTNLRNYRFDDAGEERLSQWMEKNLRVAVFAITDPSALEKELIDLARPPINLTGCENPDGDAIREARKAWVELARAAEPRRTWRLGAGSFEPEGRPSEGPPRPLAGGIGGAHAAVRNLIRVTTSRRAVGSAEPLKGRGSSNEHTRVGIDCHA